MDIFLNNIKSEYKLFKKQWKIIIINIFFLIYISSIVARNLAYYRNRQDSVLKDIGFELLPELDENKNVVFQ